MINAVREKVELSLFSIENRIIKCHVNQEIKEYSAKEVMNKGYKEMPGSKFKNVIFLDFLMLMVFVSFYKINIL